MYELIILSLLAQWPLHGYRIAKITNDMLGPYARLSNGRLYPLLAKLAADGLIVSEDAPDAPRPAGGRRSRAYAITEAGRLRFHALMMDTTTNLGDYQRIFWYKVPSLYLLGLSKQLYLVDHFITYCQSHVFHYIAETADLSQHAEHFQGSPAFHREATMYVLDHVLKGWRLQLEDALQLRARIVAESERLPESPSSPAIPHHEAHSDVVGADSTVESHDTLGDLHS